MPGNLGTLKYIVRKIWYRIKAIIQGRTIKIENIHHIKIYVNEEPISSSVEVSGVPGGIQIMYPTPYLLKPDDRVKVKTRSVTQDLVVKVELIWQEWAEAEYPLSDQEEERK